MASRCRIGLLLVMLGAPLASSCDDWHAWDDVFVRTPAPGAYAWTGGDGAVSITLVGDRTLWIFGDSLVTPLDANGNRADMTLGGVTFGNTIGIVSTSSSPSPANAKFYSRSSTRAVADITTSSTDFHGAFFDYTMLGVTPPSSPLTPFGLWPNGGICLDCSDTTLTTHNLLLSFDDIAGCTTAGNPSCLVLCDPQAAGCDTTKGIESVAGVIAKVAVPNASDPSTWSVTAHAVISTDVRWGNAILQEGPNDYYIYGYDSPAHTTLFLAHSTPANLLSPTQWDYWYGNTYNNHGSRTSSQLQVVAHTASTLSSVTKITRYGNTQYVLVNDKPTVDHYLYVRTNPTRETFPDIDADTPKANLESMDTSIQWMELIRYLNGQNHTTPACAASVHNLESDFRGCGTNYHGRAVPGISFTDSNGISSLVFSYIVPQGGDGTATDSKYYRPKFGALPLDNLPAWCVAAGQPCWYGIGRLYNTVSLAAGASSVTYAYDVSKVGTDPKTHVFDAALLNTSGNVQIYVSLGSAPPTTTSYLCTSTTECHVTVPAGQVTAQVMVHATTAASYSMRIAYPGI